MRHADVERLDARIAWWVPAVTAPGRDWAGMPGCRRGACLEWIMAHRNELVRTAPGATVAPVILARWLLGLA